MWYHHLVSSLWEAFGGLNLPKHGTKLPKLKLKHYKSVELS